MFVFGEVQDPTTETVNLVEDIVRGQIIELVRTHSSQYSRDTYSGGTLTGHPLQSYLTSAPPLQNVYRSFRRVIWLADAGHGISPRRISYSSSDTTVRK